LSEFEVDWDKYAEEYDLVTIGGANPAYEDLMQLVYLHRLVTKLSKDSLVVDLGCGTFNFSSKFARLVPYVQILGIDSSPKMVEIAEEKTDGLDNVTLECGDIEDIQKYIAPYGRKIDQAIMIHCLYATRSQEDSEKPNRILKNLSDCMNQDKDFILSDINRELAPDDWKEYCIDSVISRHNKDPKGLVAMTDKLKKVTEAYKANQFIQHKQQIGDFLMCNLHELKNRLKHVGLKPFYAKDTYYRGIDNYIIAQKI